MCFARNRLYQYMLGGRPMLSRWCGGSTVEVASQPPVKPFNLLRDGIKDSAVGAGRIDFAVWVA